MLKADLLINGASELVTPSGKDVLIGADMDSLNIIQGGSVAALEGKIVFAGSSAEAENLVDLIPGGRKIDACGGTIMPGFVDPHTHTVFAGDRSEEFDLRLKGHTYADIAERGGGILSTVKATRAAGEDELFELGMKRLDSMMSHGTTTVEVKSGYGLETATELKILRVIRRLNESHPLTVLPTFLGAHEVPPEYRAIPDGMNKYANVVTEEMLPVVAAEGLADYCDIFTEKGVYDVPTSRRILLAAKDLGLKLRVHVDQLNPLGGAEMAADLGAVSADHLEFVSEEGIRMLAKTKTIAGLLPGCVFFLMMKEYPPARQLIDSGVPVSLATDFNPGSSHCESMPMTITLACLNMKMTVAEAVVASTINAAASLDMSDTIGTLEVGKKADILILNETSHYHLVYHWGINPVKTVIKDGKVVWENKS